MHGAVAIALGADDLLGAARRVALAGALVVALVVMFVVVFLGSLFGLSGGGHEPGGGGALAEIPAEQLLAMQAAGEASGCGLPWPVLAAIARQESDFGRNMATSSAGAIGYGQFQPGTWALYGHGGNPYDYRDALPAMARYLCALGAGTSLEQALWSYSGCNPLLDSTCHRTDTYVQDALALASRYVAPATAGQGASGPLPAALDGSLVQHALRYLGVPYLWGGTSTAGLDCSGLVWLAFHEIGITLPRTAEAQYEATVRVSKDQLQPGDLVFFWATDGVQWVSHVGIYLGQGQMVDAPTTGSVVRIDSVFTGYWGAHYYGGGRVRA
jgi:cell wall-associated NlpC family hydrolase